MEFTYKLIAFEPDSILRSDNAIIPKGNNGDWQLYEAWLEGGNTPEPADIIVLPMPPDWDGLASKVLGGELLSLFNRLTSEAINSNAIALARNDINLAVTVVKNENALAAGLALLQQCGFVFTEEEKQLWNSNVAKLGFNSVIQI